MYNLSLIEDWKKYLGLLPIKLLGGDEDVNKHILLNGGSGDFCLHLNEDILNEDYYFSSAWSSNTKNFVAYDGNNVTIFNWKKSKREVIASDLVNKNFTQFYEYLLANSHRSDQDITPFVVNIFRKIRNLVNDKEAASESLTLLFYLLASLEENLVDIDHGKWGLQNIAIPNTFADYIAEFHNGIPTAKPKLELIIRHSAGMLFQEAQKEVLFFNKQTELFSNTLSGTYKSQSILYSSIHYTPAYLARAIVENTINKLDLTQAHIKIFDPACGCSEFLMETLKQLKSRNFAGSVNIIGWDSSASAINTSQFLLNYEKREWEDRLKIDLRLVKDSLTEQWADDYDCILMNPPFLSWELMSKDQREAVRATLDDTFEGKPNQASAFFYKSIVSLRNNGVIGSVIPTSLLTFDAYQKFRGTLKQMASFSLMGKLGNFVFEDALTDVSIVIGSKSLKQQLPLLVWSKNQKGIASEALRNLRKVQYSQGSFKVDKDYSIYQPSVFPLNINNWRITSYDDSEFFKNVERFVKERKLTTVQSIFNVQQGIRSGFNNAFKLSENQLKLLPEKEQQFFRPVIDNEAIDRGLLVKKNFIWYPYNKNGMIFITEDQLAAETPEFYRRNLLANKDKLQNRAGISEWWGLTRARNWQFEHQAKLCSTEFGKSNSFAFDISGEFVVERGNAWIPKRSMTKNDFYCYLAIFSSSVFDKLLSVYSKELLSGWDLGKKFTKDIPIPSVYSDAFKFSSSYEILVNLGKALSSGELRNTSPIDETLQRFLYPTAKS